ncbi:MAG: DUF2878 domain-containing protein [Nevskiaceae bacterium]|nr:MAG: DUF2878 domain-containing protein [Nevskiaceae bacterium]TBR71666.1 MAG: DUF2878 domain-containing protein [Nevskiaceae bacterium]
MNFWLTFFAYEAVWFAAVIGAGQGLAWPGIAAAGLFVAWRLGVSAHRSLDLELIAVALAFGILLDGLGVWFGLLRYAAPWPWPAVPAWLTALWIAFAVTIVPLFGYLHQRPWLAAALGAVGGPLSYLGAIHGWHAAHLSPPAWRALAVLALGWGIALPLLCTWAAHGLRTRAQTALRHPDCVP